MMCVMIPIAFEAVHAWVLVLSDKCDCLKSAVFSFASWSLDLVHTPLPHKPSSYYVAVSMFWFEYLLETQFNTSLFYFVSV